VRVFLFFFLSLPLSRRVGEDVPTEPARSSPPPPLFFPELFETIAEPPTDLLFLFSSPPLFLLSFFFPKKASLHGESRSLSFEA